jgi:hypothetical protein
MNNIQIRNYFGNNISPRCTGVRGSINTQSELPCSQNSGILSEKGSMPAKFQTADNSQTFSLARKSYINVPNCSTWISKNNKNCNIPVVRVDVPLSNNCKSPIDDPKWSARKIRGNGHSLITTRNEFENYQYSNGKKSQILDNSELIRRKKTLAIGSSSNISQVNEKTSFQGYAPNMKIITSVADQSLRRVRNSGYVVPPKVYTRLAPCTKSDFTLNPPVFQSFINTNND